MLTVVTREYQPIVAQSLWEPQVVQRINTSHGNDASALFIGAANKKKMQIKQRFLVVVSVLLLLIGYVVPKRKVFIVQTHKFSRVLN